MRKYLVLSCGDKLRALRKKYKLKQDELSGTEITRNLLSEIETGKANLTRNTAEVIFKNLKVIAKKKKIKISETVDYLIENETAQASKILDKYINELRNLSITKDNSFIEVLNEVENFLMKWDVKDKKIIIYELAGNYYCNNNEMYKSIIYYEREIDLIGKLFPSQELINVLRKLAKVYEYVGNYTESIKCCEFALNRFDDMSKEEVVVFRYNNALSYYGMENFQIALHNLKLAEELVNETDSISYIKILNNKAICFCKMKMYNDAIKAFNKIFEFIDKDDVEKHLINIVDVYMDSGERDKSIETLNAIINDLPNLNNDSSYIPEVYFEMGKIYGQLNKISLSEEYYLKALDFCERRRDYVLANDVLCALVDFYINENNVSKMNVIKDKVLNIANKQDKISNILMYKLISFYNKINDNAVSEITNYALKFNQLEGCSC